MAERLGCGARLSDAHELIAIGPSYIRQRRVAETAGGDLHAVVSALVHEMGVGRPAALVG